jgi:threonine dehydrogenase-like Zn-dependent dehydrogenase
LESEGKGGKGEMKFGRAAVMVGYKKPFEIRTYPLPDQIESGAVLVKMLMAGVCGTDVHTWLGHTGGKVLNFPVILGHENVGEIMETGGDVRDWNGVALRKGDRITWPTTIGTYCYQCFNCTVAGIPNKCLQRKTYGAAISSEQPPHFLGGWGEYCYLFPKTSLFKLPEGLPVEALVASGCAAPTMVHAAEKADIHVGDTVVIQGSGPVGLFGLVVARESGAGRVIVVGGPKERLEMVRRWGGEAVVDIGEIKAPEDRVHEVKKLSLSGYGADVVFECSGVPSAFPEGVQFARDGGRYIIVGQFMDAGPAEAFHPFWITFKELTVKGSYSWEPRHTARAVALIDRIKDRYPLQEIVSHRFTLEQTTEAVQAVKDWKTMKAVLVP